MGPPLDQASLLGLKAPQGVVGSPLCNTFSIMRKPRLRSAEVPFGSTPQILRLAQAMFGDNGEHSCFMLQVSWRQPIVLI